MLHDEPHATTMPSTRVDVDHAIEEFNLLSQRLCVQSESESRMPHSETASAKTFVSSHDIEKGDLKDEPTPFNLRAYLTSSNDANQAAGIKHKVWNRLSSASISTNSRPLEKHVGVLWEDLQVDVVGRSDQKVRSQFSRSILF